MPAFARAGGGSRLHMGAASLRDTTIDGRTKVFFKGFPTAIPKRLLTAWFDALYERTGKEPGLERHIGSQTSFAVSFPSAEGAKRFMDQVSAADAEDHITLDFKHRDSSTHIKMEPQYRSSVYGKALASVWKAFSGHIDGINNNMEDVRNLRLIMETDRGRIRVETEDEVLLLAHIHEGALILNPEGLDDIDFPAAARTGVLRDFVA